MSMKILTPNGFRGFYKIDKKEAKCFKITFDDDSSIKCSTDHKFDNDGKVVIASDLKVGNYLQDKCIKTIEDIGIQPVYTPVQVEDGHKYFSNGLVHYNCSFLGSSHTLVDGEYLKKIIPQDPIRTEDNFHINIYEDPIPGVLYVMGVDSSTGVGNDACAIQVIKVVNAEHFEQVATYKNDKIKPYEFAQVIAKMSSRYNEAFMVLENNEAGTGHQVAEELWYNIGCGNVLNTDKRGGIGTRATQASKLAACMMLKKAMETNKLTLVDVDTINQLSRFEEITPNVFRGTKGTHDDLISALYWAIYCLNQPQIDLESAKIVTQSVQDDYAPPPCMFDEKVDNSDFWRSFN